MTTGGATDGTSPALFETENVFTVTQLSDTTAVMEFHVAQNLKQSPPLTFTFSYDKTQGIWKASEPKSRVIMCFTVNAPGIGLGPFAWMANNVEIIFVRSTLASAQHDMILRLCAGNGCYVGQTVPVPAGAVAISQ
jgi:hypothetical protein